MSMDKDMNIDSDAVIMEKLKNAGVNVDELTERLMHNMNLIKRFARRFPDDSSYAKLVTGMEKGDAGEAFRAAHTLKGVSANLSMTGLYKLLSEQVEYLRAGDIESGRKIMPAIKEEYEKTIAGIESINWEQ